MTGSYYGILDTYPKELKLYNENSKEKYNNINKTINILSNCIKNGCIFGIVCSVLTQIFMI